MPTATHTYTWDANADSWNDGGLNWFTWDGTNGDPAPGCLHVNNPANRGFDTLLRDVIWEDYGVPAGATVVSATASVHYKQVSLGLNPKITMAVQVRDRIGAQIPVSILTATLTTGLDAWQTVTGAGAGLPAWAQASNAPVRVSMGNGSVLGFDPCSDAYWDTLQITVTYLAPPTPIYVIPRTFAGVLSRVHLSSVIFPNGGNPLYARACFGGLIRAGTVSHLNQALFNLYFAGAQNNDDFTAAIVNYGTPTPVIINDPQLGHEVWVDIAPTDIVDLAQFKSGYMGNVKLRRAGGDNTYRGPVVFRGMTLKYKKRQT